MSEEEYEYEEVTDYGKIAKIIAGIAVAVVLGLFFAGVFTVDFLGELPEINIEDIEIPIQPVENEPEVEPITEVRNEPKVVEEIPEEPSINEKLLKEFLSFGLSEEEITDVLAADCETISQVEEIQPKHELLYQAKNELCFGAVQGE